MIDAVCFDLDDTICTYRRHGSTVLAEAFEHVGVDPVFAIEDYYAAYDEYADEADTVEAGRVICFAALAEEAGRAPDLGRAVARAYAARRDHRDVRFLPDAREAIEALGREFPLALVTNGAPEMQTQKLAALSLDDSFETVVHAPYDATAKPSPAPFRLALDALGVRPDRAVHVGNSLSADVAGAKAAGLRTIWVSDDDPIGTSDGPHEPDYVVSSLSELLTLPWARSE